MKYKTLFLIDDDIDDLEFFRSTLESIDTTINCVCENRSEVDLMALMNEEIKPDWIVSDLNMPRLCGQTLLLKLKQSPALKNIPFFMLSTSDQTCVIKQIKELGADEYFVKPCSIDAMKQIINKILSFVIVE